MATENWILVVDDDTSNLTMANSILSGAGNRVSCVKSEEAAEDIVKEIERAKERASTSFIVGSTEYLARSGRISSKINALCEALMLHPVIVLKKSSMTIGGIRFGTREHIWRGYVRSALRHGQEIDRRALFITHAGLQPDELEEISAMVKEKMDFEEVYYQKASPAISTNCGPDSFGLLFMRKSM